MDVSAWLQQLGLGEYAAAFAANHVDAATLRQLTADDLRDIGVASVGHRRRLLEAIAALQAAPQAAPGPAAFETERRPVAVLFADLCGSTALARDLPDEQLHALLDGYFAMADGIVKRHGGTVDKHIGDAVMALFGAPVAHDDDMLRASRAALELRTRLPELSRTSGRELAMHAGLAAGELIVGASGGDWTVVGETVNLAARLTDLAAPGEILVSGPVQQALAGRASFEARGRHAVKGFADAVEVWRLAGLADPTAVAPLTPFVGRTTEMSQIAALLQSCVAGGGGGIVYVRGEPGIGKSRLVGEARALAAQRGIACHVCHVLDFGAGHERDPLRRLADSLLGLMPDSTPEVRAAAVSAVLADGHVEPRLRPFLHEIAEAPLPSGMRGMIDASDENSRRVGRRDALALLVRLAQARAPMMLLIEDLHWADAALVDALLPLARLAGEGPLLLTLTSRPENEQLLAALRQQPAGAPLVSIDLGPLRPQDATAMVDHLGRLPESTLRQCVERAGGNPLFLEQLLRNAAEMAGDLPPSLRGLVVARVDRLSAADRAAIQAAAVLGQRFDPAALQAMLGNPVFDPAGLLQAGLLRIDGMELIFAHALIREAVQRSLLAEALRALHSRAAEWFAGRDPILHASHLDRAGSAQAADAYRAAAWDRLQRYRPDEALPLAERGLELATDAGSKAALLLLKADVLLDIGRAREALAASQAALEVDAGPRVRSLALLGSASARRILDELPAALNDVAAALALAEEGGWPEIQARCRFTRGNLYFPLGRVEECLVEHQAALDLADRTGSAEAKARALGGLGDAEYARGHVITCGRYFRQCVEEARRIGLGRVEVSNLPMYAHTLLFELRLPECIDVARESVALAAAVGQRRAEMIANHACAAAMMESGRFDEARACLVRCQEIVRALEAWRFEAENLAFLSEIELEAGRMEVVRQLLEEGLALARRTGMAYWGPALLAFNARVHPDAEARSALVAECETLLSGSVLAHNHYLARNHLINLGIETGEPDFVDRQSERLLAFYNTETMPLADFIARRGRVLAAMLRGAPSPAVVAEAQALLDKATRIGAVRLAVGLREAAQAMSA
jgi:class 3 adenylate cyclase/tetratricopeptide (TPR) repeat protein